MPRLVLVPGLGLDERSSRRLRSWIGSRIGSRIGCRIAADVIHLPGMGLPEPVPSVDALAGRLRAALGPGPVVLVGHSQSCQVAAAAAEREDRIAALVLLGPTTDPRLRFPAVLVARWLRTAAAEPKRQAPGTLAQWWHTGPRAMWALWRSAAPDRIDRRLPGVAVPVTVVRGTRDRLCPHDWALALSRAAPRGRLVELPGAAHMTVQTHPDDVGTVLADAVRRASR